MSAGRALITGGCSGIGLELARELARRGHPLVLVSNREDRLAAAAQTLSKDHGVEVQTVTMDLARPEAPLALYEEIGRRKLEVEILVNNAGMFFFGEVVDHEPAKISEMLQLHMVTPTLLTRYFARDMRERRHGHVLIVSSISAWRDFPGIALYGSTKRYLHSFATALRAELEVWGVNVTCLAPGATATGLFDHLGVQVQLAMKYRVMVSPDFVARRAVKGLFAGKAVVLPGMRARLSAWLMALTPDWVIGLMRRRLPFLPRP